MHSWLGPMQVQRTLAKKLFQRSSSTSSSQIASWYTPSRATMYFSLWHSLRWHCGGASIHTAHIRLTAPHCKDGCCFFQFTSWSAPSSMEAMWGCARGLIRSRADTWWWLWSQLRLSIRHFWHSSPLFSVRDGRLRGSDCREGTSQTSQWWWELATCSIVPTTFRTMSRRWGFSSVS